MNESGFRIRVSTALRQDFVETCRALDLTAAQVLRSYMREFVASNQDARQEDLFEESSANMTPKDVPTAKVGSA